MALTRRSATNEQGISTVRQLNILGSHLLLILLAVSPLQAGVFYVSPDGDAGNPGTRELPFATVFHARDAVRAHVARGLSEDVEVVLLLVLTVQSTN